MTADHFITHLQLQPHPEGGFFKETYRSSGIIPSQSLTDFNGDRHYSTAIYFLLEQGNFSAFHRIKSDECWHFYEGDTLLIHVIDNKGNYSCTRLGRKIDEGEMFQFVVPAGCWFASETAPETPFTLVGCTVAPGFDFADFEMANAENLSKEYPQHESLIRSLCR
ncbi:MAG: cupin domain-containing protein [Flavisolibacter sp.]|nr:cupin domain-containing protein [Flavisolibacter sp.]